uniref:NADH-ubiquinone oxidoreductase chain 4 n=1 Tax=Chaetosoma scaritides TaxID=546502 RepID=B6D8W5_9CUCU|nr:NADH dehydrogenase subunit 4 [Chaetosoma scaritides]ACF35103.1 NADH dehydrogenase subunit 4 [Chaetosoma scaritides]
MVMIIVFLIPLVFLINYWLIYLMLSYLFLFMLLKFSYDINYLYISYFFGIDLLSYMMLLLSLFICMLMILASMKIYNNNNNLNYFLMLNLILLFSLILTFCSLNLFVFYLFFEISLIPVFFLILGWGYQPERIQAGIYLLFYTLFASLPMMISILFMYKLNMSMLFMFLGSLDSLYMYMLMNMVFLIKMPMFFIHLWLPKAHVEAPIAGSMILAGVMLKLGGYGLMRLMVVFMKIGLKINLLFIVISLIGGIYVSFICLCQSDMKSLIAYSSVGHMGMVLSGIMTMNYWGMSGALVMMIAHGLCSSGLFCLSNISYERLLSRSIYLNKGLINLIPSLSLWWFLFCSSNMAAPPSLNLMGEIFLINSLISWDKINMLFLSIMSFMSACYSLFLYSYSQHGKFYSGMFSSLSGSLREYLLLFLHWVPLNLLVIKGEYMFMWV